MITFGIDLGTANSTIALFDGHTPQLIPNSYNETIIPSKVILLKDGRFFCGRDAAMHAERFEAHNFTIGSVKRQLHDCSGIIFEGKRYYPQIISAMVLAQLKKQAEEYLKMRVDEAVVCIPCNFGVMQRYATLEAAEMAGIKVIRMLNEATAAALAFIYLNKTQTEQKEFIFDLGAGTLDLSLINYGEGVVEVECTEGDEFLGGDDFDDIIIKYIVDETKKTQGFDPIDDQPGEWHHIAKLRIKEAAEKAKIELSSQPTTRIYIPCIRNILGKIQNIDLEISAEIFSSLSKELIDKIMLTIDQVIERSSRNIISERVETKLIKRTVDERKIIDKILLKKPKLKEVIENVFSRVPFSLETKFVFTGGGSKVKFVKEAIQDRYKNKNIKFINRSKDLVALGAAVYAGMIRGGIKDWLLLDCTARSIGLELLGGVFEKIIPKNTTLPYKKSQTFTTTVDDQQYIHISVYEGEKPMASDNRKIIDLEFGPLPKAKKGIPQVEVTFNLDADNFLRVEAVDLAGTCRELKNINTSSPYTKLNPELKEKIAGMLDRWVCKNKA